MDKYGKITAASENVMPTVVSSYNVIATGYPAQTVDLSWLGTAGTFGQAGYITGLTIDDYGRITQAVNIKVNNFPMSYGVAIYSTSNFAAPTFSVQPPNNTTFNEHYDTGGLHGLNSGTWTLTNTSDFGWAGGASGRLQYTGNDTRWFLCSVNFMSAATQLLGTQIVINRGGTPITYYQYFSQNGLQCNMPLQLQKNDYMSFYLRVSNTGNFTGQHLQLSIVSLSPTY